MNILPKKSWHVRNKKNIEKVRRDEEKAAEEEKAKEQRIALAESESRSEFLRTLARKRHANTTSSTVSTSEPTKHINFFEHLESGEKVARKNKQHEEESKAEKEKQEKAIGILTYLGQGSAELEDKKPWYCEPQKPKASKDELELKKKNSLDPLKVMNKYIKYIEKHGTKKDVCNNQKTKSEAKPAKKNKKKSIEELRLERNKRERCEQLRQQQLLDKLNPTETKDDFIYDERQMPYNSRFIPDLPKFK